MKIEDLLKTNFKTAQQRALVNIRYTSNFLSAKQSAFMQKFDLTMPQFNILRILRGANEALNIQTIKERMVEKSPNTTRLMDKLIEKKLIERIRCEEDRRIIFVEITQLGLDVLSEIDVQTSENDFLKIELSNQEANLLSDLLDKVRSSYKQH